MATTILYNGLIHTLNPDQPRAQALAVRDGRVLAVGSEGKVAAAAGGRAEPLNLQGRAVVPGLCDAHIHLTAQGLSRRRARLDDTASVDAALQIVARQLAQGAVGGWLRGGGWSHAGWGGAWPTAAQLDAVVGDVPVFLSRKDGHSAWVSGRALQLAGIADDTPDPPGGQIQRDRDGRATGILLETAQELVLRVMPHPTPDDRQRALRDAMAELLSYGITSVHIPPGTGISDGRDTLFDLQVLRERGQLALRCLTHIQRHDLPATLALGVRSGLGDEWLRIGGLKLFADGSLGSESAEMLTPYEGRRHTGIATLTEEELNAAVRDAAAGGISVIVHAIGDAANRKVLDAIEENDTRRSEPSDAGIENGTSPIPNRIEHAQVLHPRDIARFAQLGVVASMQPIHATADMAVAEQLWGARSAHAYAWRALKQAGALLAFGSDAPVESANPWWGVHAAVTRQLRDGTPPGGWRSDQRLTVSEALEAYCVGPAICSGEAALKGMLKPGMIADLAVLSADPFACPPEQLHGITAELTMVGGAVVWEKPK
jgi:predicted amidohydrolase YtcJ